VRDARPGNTVPGTFRGQADGRGLKYLRRVAVVFGVNVVAGIDVQTAPLNSGNRFTQWQIRHGL
jgi:hypothetical protein